MSQSSPAATVVAGAGYEVGQRVWVYDVNAGWHGKPGEPVEGRVTKVGRKLVTVEYGYGYTKVFRAEDATANDNYRHLWIKTDEQRSADEHIAALSQRLHAAGIRFELGTRPSVGLMERLAAALDG